MELSKYVFILLLLLVILYINWFWSGFRYDNFLVEMFSAGYQTFQSFIPTNGFYNKFPMYPLTNSPSDWFYRFFPISNGYTNLPFNNSPLGNTTNMSYDLRGDPLEIPRTDFVWNNSSTFPIYNPPI